MARVSVAPSVLRWALDQSGYDAEEVDAKLGADVASWLRGDDRPTLTQLRQLATLLRRPLAAFLLPRPPPADAPAVAFRHAPGVARTALNTVERRYLREAGRQQRVLAWMIEELGEHPQRLLRASERTQPSQVADDFRKLMSVGTDEQSGWRSASHAFREWRGELERLGVLVFAFPMGRDSCRGFSLSHDSAPIVAVNTAWNAEARIFSLFHEVAHLITGTASACADGAALRHSDPTERWCEKFSSHVLVPEGDLASWLANSNVGNRVDDLRTAGRLARHFKVSLRAAVLRLIELRVATWSLFAAIPATADDKTGGRAPEEPRRRAQIRRDQYGDRTATLYLKAVGAEVVSRSDVLGYLDLSDGDLDTLQGDLVEAGRDVGAPGWGP